MGTLRLGLGRFWLVGTLLLSLLAGACDTEVQTPSLNFDDAPVAKLLAKIRFLQPVSNTVAAGPYAFLLHEDSGFSVVELGNNVAEEPKTYGPFTSQARIVAVEYDEAARVAYLIDASGIVLIVDLSAAASIRVLASLSVRSLDVRGTDAATTVGAVQIARNGQRLFVLVGRLLQPIFINRVAGAWSLVPEKSVRLPRAAFTLSASGGYLYLGFSTDAGAVVEAWTISVLGELQRVSSFDVGGELRSLLSRGAKVIVLSRTVGLTVLDFYRINSPRIIYQNAQFDDVGSARLFGRTLLVSLETRQFVSALDVSDFARPFVLTTNKGFVPEWIALIQGNLFMGDAEEGTIAGIPPVVAASVPERIRTAFPTTGQFPITFSKQIDPSSLLISGAIKLVCNGQVVDGSPWLSPDGFTINFRPLLELALSAQCTLDVGGLLGWNAIALASGVQGTAINFTTVATQSAPTTPGSSYPHTADGKFTDCEIAEADDGEDAGTPAAPSNLDAGTGAGANGECEWHDVSPAQGRYTYFYADFDGENLWILNDWFYNGEDINPDCFNQFQAWTGNGAERWEIRAYGDQRVEVMRNGIAVDAATMGVEGGKSYGPSPNVAEPHTIYEIKIPAMAGSWGVQLHDPGPTFQCEHLEAETTPLSGSVRAGQAGGSISVDTTLTVPTEPTLARPADGAEDRAIDEELSWTDDNDVDNFVYYRVEVATDAAFLQRVIDTTTWSKTLTPWRGTLQPDTEYFWRVTALNQAGSATSMPFSFTTTATPSYNLTTAVLGQGSIRSNDSPRTINCNDGGGQCGAQLVLGDDIMLMAQPAEGWTFAGWSGACSGTSASLDLEIQGDTYCAAVFNPPNDAVTVWVSRSGTGSGTVVSTPGGIDCGSDCTEVYPKGVEIGLTATPNEGSTFVGWSGDCSGAGNAINVMLDQDTYCTAVFSVPPPGQYTLNVYAGNGGSIASADGGIACPSTTCSANYTPGTSVTLTATPMSGHSFVRWTGNCSGTSRTTSVSIDGHRSCSAEFQSNTPELDVIVNGPGSVTSAPSGINCTSAGGNSCSKQFPRNSMVMLTAQASGQGMFSGWSGDCSGSSATTTVTIDRAKTCYASFEQSRLYVYVSGSGTVTANKGGISCANNGGTCNAMYNAGTSVTLTATPGQGYAFSGWSGDCSGSNAMAALNVTGTKSCTASFVTKTLNVYVTGLGTVTSDPAGISCTSNGGSGCSQNYSATTEVQLTAAPGQDYVFIGWSGCSSSTNASINVSVANSLACYASFASNSNTLGIYGSGNGNGSVTTDPAGGNCTITAGQRSGSCGPIYAYGQEVTLTAAPATNKDYFAGWSGNCQGTGLTTTVTMNGSLNCYATFSKNRITLSVASGVGTITGDRGGLSCTQQGGTCTADITVGNVVQLTAAAGTDYTFTGWGGCSSSTNTVINVPMNQATACYAYFTTYTLSTYVSPASTGTIESGDDRITCTTNGGNGCSANYATYGQVVQLTATPVNSNYVFVGWSGNCSGTDTATNITLNGSRSCTATFQQRTLTAYVNQGAGTITSDVGSISCTTYGGSGCSATFGSNTQVELTAAPGTNNVFTSWSGDCSGTELTTTVNVDRARNCYANFTPNLLSIGNGGGGGTGTVTSSPGSINCVSTTGSGTCSQFYAYNQQVMLTATPSLGSQFSYWAGNCSGSNAEITVTMTGSRNCQPVFTLQSYTGSVSVTGNGGVASNINGLNCGGDCSQDIPYGTEVTVTAVPFPGETFIGWGGACATAGTEASVTVPMPAMAIGCTAEFSTNNNPDFAGTFSSSTYDSAQCSDWNAFRTDLSSSVTYARIRVRGSEDTTGYTCEGASANTLCQALRTGGSASVMCDGQYWNVGACSSTTELHVGPASQTCGCGGTDHFTVRPCYPSAGYNGFGNSCGNNTAQTLTVNCVESTVSVQVSGGGSVTADPVGIDCPGDCSEDYANSTEVTLTATPNDGETFLGWGGDCDASGTNTESMVSASTSNPVLCTAQFTSSTPSVLILAAEGATPVNSLQTALTNTGAFSSVSVLLGPSVPTVQTLEQYDVVLLWTNSSFSNVTTLGDNLADYYDAGGRVVVTMFALGGHSFGGRFATVSEGYILMNPAGGYGSCSGNTLGTVSEPASALMNGVTSVSAGNYCSNGAVVNNGTVVAYWSGSFADPMIVRGNVMGRNRVDLNMYLATLGGDAVTVIKNALLYQ